MLVMMMRQTIYNLLKKSVSQLESGEYGRRSAESRKPEKLQNDLKM